MTKPKILVIRGGAIGDFILTLPAIAALRRQFPQAHLEVLGYPHIVQLALAGGLVDRAQPIEARGLAGFFARDGELAAELTDYFSEFDIVISYLYDPDEIFKTNVARCLHGQFIAGPHRPEEEGGTHATRVFLKPLERMAIFDADPVPRLAINSQPLVAPKPDVGGSTINQLALHPGSGSAKKNWPEAKWLAFVARLIESSNLDVLLVGGEAEGDRLERLAGALPAARVGVARSLPLVELARRLGSCAGFVGHDSGISHLAAALGLPCVILWADSVEEVWRPQGERLVIVREAAGIRAITVERVLAELGALLQPEQERA